MAVGMIFNPYTAGRFGPRPPAGVVGRAMSPASVPTSDPTLASALATPAAETPRPVLTIGPESDALAKALLAQASQGEVRTPFEALGKLAQLGAGTWAENKFQKAEKDRETAPWTAFRDAMASGKTLEQALAGSNDPTLLKLYAESKLKTAAQPNIETFYDDKGREVKGIYDATAPNGYRPVGGAKASSDATVTPHTDEAQAYADFKNGYISEAELADRLNTIKTKNQGDEWVDLPADSAGNVYQQNKKTGEKKLSVKTDRLVVGKNAQILQDGKWVTPPPISETSPGMFDTKSIAGQGLNWLVQNHKISQEDAANMASGKVITTPTGEMIFVTPEGIFSKANPQAPAVPITPPADGSVPPVPAAAPVPADAGKIPLTGAKNYGNEEQTKAGGFADRAVSAADTIDKVGAAGASFVNRNVAKLPGGVGNYLEPQEYQVLDQAERNFVNAILRRESGAAISQSEFDNARQQYFPQPGDGPEVLAAKKLNRQQTITSLQSAAGPNYPHQVLTAPGGAPAAPAATPSARPRAVNPTTHEVLEFDGQNWVPAQ